MKKLRWSICFTLALVLFSGGSVTANVPAETNAEGALASNKQCIQVSRIKNIDILDNQTIVFYMRNNSAWLNRLPYQCPQLYHEGGIVYDVILDKLCSVDVISVVDGSARCGLGTFAPYDGSAEKEDKQ